MGRAAHGSAHGCTCPRWSAEAATIVREFGLTVRCPDDLETLIGRRVERTSDDDERWIEASR
jgi:hypothetical protein